MVLSRVNLAASVHVFRCFSHHHPSSLTFLICRNQTINRDLIWTAHKSDNLNTEKIRRPRSLTLIVAHLRHMLACLRATISYHRRFLSKLSSYRAGRLKKNQKQAVSAWWRKMYTGGFEYLNRESEGCLFSAVPRKLKMIDAGIGRQKEKWSACMEWNIKFWRTSDLHAFYVTFSCIIVLLFCFLLLYESECRAFAAAFCKHTQGCLV